MFGHWSWADIPYIKEDQLISIEECVRAHRQGKIFLSGEWHSVEMGVNSLRSVDKGSLVYDQASQSYSCTDEPGRQNSDSSKHLKSELKMTIYELVLGRTPGRLRTDSNRVIVAGGLHEGTELSSLEVQTGGKERDGVTLVLDHPGQVTACPFAILRERVELTQYMMTEGDFGEPVDLYAAAGGGDLDLTGVALVGEQIAIRLEEREVIPTTCHQVTGGERGVFRTNHAGVLAVHLTENTDMKSLKDNNLLLQEMDLDLTTASRLDLMGYHVSAALRNLSNVVQEENCLSRLDDLKNVLMAQQGYKIRVLPAGELLVISKCKHLVMEFFKPGNSTSTNFCPTYLPVKSIKDRAQTGTAETWWLEPKTRFLYKESPKKACGLTKILPSWFELKNGQFISFDGQESKLQQVEPFQWLAKKRYFSETGLDVWKDLEAQGMMEKRRMEDLEIYQEYSIYLTKKSAEDQGVGDHEGTPIARASGQAVRSWMRQVKGRADRIMEEGMDAVLDEVGLSDLERVWKAMSDGWKGLESYVRTMGMIGGTLYLIKRVLSMVGNFIKFCCTKGGNQVDEDYKIDKRYKWCYTMGGCAGKVTQACCICSLEVCCGEEARKRAVLERMIKEVVSREMMETRAHLRDEAYLCERRRESEGNALEMAELVPSRRR